MTSRPTASAHIRRIHRRLAREGHDLPVRLWDGTELGPADATYRLVLHHPWSLRSMLAPPTDLRAGEAFISNDFDVEGSMLAAMTDVVQLRQAVSWPTIAACAVDLLRTPRSPRGTIQRPELQGRVHSKSRDRAAVQHHYDVGHEFYRLFLDHELVYSCAYFTAEDDDLDRAQVRKLDLVCRKLGLREGMRLLDIGCGWGALVLHAARKYGVDALGVTLSEDQAAVARQRVRAAALEGKVEIRIQDYRDVTGQFDAVASIGMVEHVGADQLSNYFRAAFARTAPGGLFLNHGITTGRRRKPRDLSSTSSSFVGKYVFPDGALVPASRAVHELEDAGFELLDVEQLRPHYARTLEQWTERLEDNRDAAIELVGDATYRIWRAYMAGSVLGFRHNDLGVVQVLGGREATTPLGRSWMTPEATSRPSLTRA